MVNPDRWRAGAAMVLLLVAAAARTASSAGSLSPGTPGGVLNLLQREELATGFSIHETATIATVWPASPCFSNLVTFDPMNPVESADSIVGELAERWSWQDNYRNLVFFLRRDVRWHDGQPFSSKDVKYTFDMVREAPDAVAKLRTSPRKEWYENVDAITIPDPSTVVFKLKRPQPALLLMLASGQSPVYPAHVPPAEFRTRCIGTGPFKLKEWRRGQYVDYVKNPDYFVKGRPYLDGLRYYIIADRGTQKAALQTGRVDVSFPGDTSKPLGEELKAAVPQLVMTVVGTGTSPHLLLNATKPPFNDPRIRLAMSHAMDRRAFVQAVTQGGAVVGAALAPAPYGIWGLSGPALSALPGYGKAEDEQAKARKLLAETGHGPSNPLKVEVLTRALFAYVDFASFVVDMLRRIGVDASMKQVDTPLWYSALTRKEFQIGANVAGYGLDDPDPVFYENYACASVRNYTGYCNEEIMRLIDQQSQELDPRRRHALVAEIEKRLELDGARPTMGWRLDYFIQRPYVHNLVPHNGIYNWGRLTNVWIDRR